MVATEQKVRDERNQPLFQIRKYSRRQLNVMQTPVKSTAHLLTPKNRATNTNFSSHRRFKSSEITRATSARKPLNVPAIVVNLDQTTVSTSKNGGVEKVSSLLNRNNSKARKSSLLVVNLDNLST